MAVNKKKYLLYIVLFILLYVIGSFVLSPTGFFVNHERINSVPMEKAIENKTIIELAKPNLVYVNSMEDEFYAYKYKFCYLKSYGLLSLFKHRVIVDNQYYFKFIVLNSLKETSQIEIQYNNLETNLFNDVDGYNAFEGEEILVTVSRDDKVIYKALYK